MQSLVLSSVLFSLSFGLIGRFLGDVDPVMVSFIRLGIAFIVFLPFLSLQGLRRCDVVVLGGIGAIQYGLMYIVYIYAFRWLSGHEVAMYTVVTPLYVCLLHAVRKRKWHGRYFAAAILATIGGGVLVGRPGSNGLLGIMLIQISNLCFAYGQVEYKFFCERKTALGSCSEHFAILYAGGALFAALVAVFGGHWQGFGPSFNAWVVLVYLGVVPSALGFYFWNRGARMAQAGTLAAANNLKIPLAVLVSLLVFRESVIWLRFLPGAIIVLVSLAVSCFAQVKRPFCVDVDT
ncbi:MAG: DMT family transporter [Kiritimatiellia bacterium]